ncbi:hypothetical protein ACFL2V_12775 [Pseudomonadota bacterium]
MNAKGRPKGNIGSSVLAALAEFLESRGGWRGLGSGTIKGLLTSLPFVGNSLNTVLYDTKEKEEQEKVRAILASCLTRLEAAETNEHAIGHLLDTIRDLLEHSGLASSEILAELTVALNQLTEMRRTLGNIEDAQQAQARSIDEMLSKLDESFVSKDRVRMYLKQCLAAYEAHRLALGIRARWPLKPVMSVYPETTSRISKEISATRQLIGKANHLLLIATENNSVARSYFEELTEDVFQSLTVYDRAQKSFKEGLDVTISEFEATPMDSDFIGTVVHWCYCVGEVTDWVMVNVAGQFLDMSDFDGM